MITLYNANHLDRFGIRVLTGEADNYGIRVLCDLDDHGVTLLRDFLGIDKIETPEAWNYGNGSILLPRTMLPDLMAYALLYVMKCPWVAIGPNGVFGPTPDEEANAEQIRKELMDDSRYRVIAPMKTVPHVGDRNVHTFTGRIK